ncbi:MAG: outer membrane beta-barrel protein [Pseudomonadota bacterium]
MKNRLKQVVSSTAIVAIAMAVNFAVLPIGHSLAADMLGDGIEGETLVEFGTGWYLRGDIGGGISDVSIETNFGGGGDADLGTPVTFGIGAGYDAGNGIRYEVGLNQFTNLDFAYRNNYTNCGTEDDDGDPLTPGTPITGDCFYSANANLNASSVMANVYYDFNKRFWGFRPYVGAGVGIAYVSWSDFTFNEFCIGNQPSDCGTTGGNGVNELASGTFEADDEFTISGNVMVGASYQLTQNTALDFGYRYTYIGDSGAAKAANNASITEDIDVGSFDIHEFRLGLRYAIW